MEPKPLHKCTTFESKPVMALFPECIISNTNTCINEKFFLSNSQFINSSPFRRKLSVFFVKPPTAVRLARVKPPPCRYYIGKRGTTTSETSPKEAYKDFSTKASK